MRHACLASRRDKTIWVRFYPEFDASGEKNVTGITVFTRKNNCHNTIIAPGSLTLYSRAFPKTAPPGLAVTPALPGFPKVLSARIYAHDSYVG